MRVVIVEDEAPAAEHLKRLIHRYEAHIQIAGVLDSVETALEWFRENPVPDLAFFDIHLSDGNSFEIFEKITLNFPVIFATAYDHYALRAFRVNSVDYLLKPISFDALADSLDKYAKLHLQKSPATLPDMSLLLREMNRLAEKKVSYKSRFVAQRGEQLVSVAIDDILYFYSEDKASLIRTQDGSRYVVNGSLNDIEEKLDPNRFFRISRSYLIQFSSIEGMTAFSRNRVRVQLHHEDEPQDVSRSRVADFRAWLGEE